MIERLCLIGAGLIGGSLALALRQRGAVREIVGMDADPANLEQALKLGIVDRVTDGIGAGAADADWIVIATPVGAMPGVLAALQPVWSKAAIYTDTGSTKSDVIQAAERIFGQAPPNFVPGHPIAGAERSGAGAANASLFENKRVILTPHPHVDGCCLRRVAALWQSIGARVSEMEPQHHDEVLAATSHLPHVLAFVLTHMLGRKDEQQEIFQYAAGGLRDFTRIASSDPRMWLDICLANRRELVPLIEQYRAALGEAADGLASGDAGRLLALFTDARAARQRFLDQLDK